MSLSELRGVILLIALGAKNTVKVLFLMYMYLSILQSGVLYSH